MIGTLRARHAARPALALAVVGLALICGCGGGTSTSTTSQSIPTATTTTTAPPVDTATTTTTTQTTPPATTSTSGTTTTTRPKPVRGPKGSKPFTSPDGLMVMNIDPGWPKAAKGDSPAGGAIWFTNLSTGGGPTQDTASITLVAEALRGATLEADVAASLKELHLKARSQTAIRLADGSPAIRVDASDISGRLVAIIALDASGKNTVSATFQGMDDAGFAARLKPIEPYLRTLRTP